MNLLHFLSTIRQQNCFIFSSKLLFMTKYSRHSNDIFSASFRIRAVPYRQNTRKLHEKRKHFTSGDFKYSNNIKRIEVTNCTDQISCGSLLRNQRQEKFGNNRIHKSQNYSLTCSLKLYKLFKAGISHKYPYVSSILYRNHKSLKQSIHCLFRCIKVDSMIRQFIKDILFRYFC